MSDSKSPGTRPDRLIRNPSNVATSPLLTKVQKDALEDLEMLMDDTYAIKKYVQWHQVFDSHLQDLEDAQCILDELGRSAQDRPSNHIIWKSVIISCRQIEKWKRQSGRYNNWEAAEAGEGQMPYLGSPAQLRALRYLGEGSRYFPQHLREYLQTVDLEWYTDDEIPPSEWWLGAQLGDPSWRNDHMQALPKFRDGEIDAEAVVGLMKKAFVRSLGGPNSAPLDPGVPTRECPQQELVATINPLLANAGGGDQPTVTALHPPASAPLVNINNPMDVEQQSTATSKSPAEFPSPISQIQRNGEGHHSTLLSSSQTPGSIGAETLASNQSDSISPSPPPHADHLSTRNMRHITDVSQHQPSKRPTPRGASPGPKRARTLTLHQTHDQGQKRDAQRLDSDQVSANVDMQPRQSNAHNSDSGHGIDALRRVATQQANTSMELAVTVAETLSSMDKAHGEKIAEIKAQLSTHDQHLNMFQSAVDEWKEKDSEREKAAEEREQRSEARLRGMEARMGELERENDGLKKQVEALRQREDKVASLERLVNGLMSGMDAVGRCFDQTRSSS